MKDSRKSTHKAVAPIIATLLMVAIAVVGGILIFVFTQGFFADEQVVGPTIDELVIFGYDSRDQGPLTLHYGFTSGGNVNDDENPDQKLDDGDLVLIYGRNVGDSPLSIESITIFEQRHTFFNSDVGGSDCYSSLRGPGLGKVTPGTFGIQTSDSSSFLCVASSVIEPNDEFTMILNYEDDGSGEVKVGKKLPIKVQTGNGQTFLLNAFNGAQRGA